MYFRLLLLLFNRSNLEARRFVVACQAYHTRCVLTSMGGLWVSPYLTHPHKPLYNPNNILYEPPMRNTVRFVENTYHVR